VARDKCWDSNGELCDIVSKIVSANEISGIDWYHMACYVLYSGILIFIVINLFIFVGNWDILTLLVMRDIMYFILVTWCGMNVMYRVMFVLVADMVVCIYVMYL